jgi:hypothetical protein
MSRTAFKEGWRFSHTVGEWRDALIRNYTELRSQQCEGERAGTTVLHGAKRSKG